MLNTALRFMSECDRAGIKYRDSRDLDNGGSLVVCGVNGQNNARYDVLFLFDPDGKGVSPRVPGILTFPEEKRPQFLELVNELNGKYRWVKFSLREGRVNVQADASITDDTSGRVCVELFLRIIKIIDDVYPEFMRTLWT